MIITLTHRLQITKYQTHHFLAGNSNCKKKTCPRNLCWRRSLARGGAELMARTLVHTASVCQGRSTDRAKANKCYVQPAGRTSRSRERRPSLNPPCAQVRLVRSRQDDPRIQAQTRMRTEPRGAGRWVWRRHLVTGAG